MAVVLLPNPSLAKSYVNVYDYLLRSLSISNLPICLHKKLKYLRWIVLYKCSLFMFLRRRQIRASKRAD